MGSVIIDSRVVPEVFLKVLEVKKSLTNGSSRTVSEAIDNAGISRSAFYKYKDYVFPYDGRSEERIYTLFFTLKDVSGALSDILNILAEYGCNVLTINQNIPVHGIANITVSFRYNGESNIGDIIQRLNEIKSIVKIDILAME